MHAAWKLDQGDFARKEISMAKIHVADTLHKAADTAKSINCNLQCHSYVPMYYNACFQSIIK
jgi:hypothetical protein